MKKYAIIMVLWMGLLLSPWVAALSYTDGPDHLWTNISNWTPVGQPGPSTWAEFFTDGTICYIVSGNNLSISNGGVGLGYNANNQLYMTGGSLTTKWLNIGRNTDGGKAGNTYGYFEMTNGTISNTVTGGNMRIPEVASDYPIATSLPKGIMKFTGGTVTTGNFLMGNRTFNKSTSNGGGYGVMILGGTAQLIENRANRTNIENWIYNGYIVPSEPKYLLRTKLELTPTSKTTLWAMDTTSLTLVALASNPSPTCWSYAEFDSPLNWTKGTGIVSEELYVSTDRAKVEAGDASVKITFPTKPYLPNGGWELEGDNSTTPRKPYKTYYWRVDGKDAGGIVKTGEIWQFRVYQSVRLDTFEEYNDPNVPLLASKWATQGTATASLTDEYLASTQLTKRLRITVPAGQAGTLSSTPNRTNWSVKKLAALRFRVLGKSSNAANAKLSVTLNNSTTVYGGLLQTPSWQWIDIRFNQFSDLNLNQVSSIAFTLEAGLTGAQLDVDDIQLVPATCITPPAGDVDGDCKVTVNDLVVMAQNWLASGIGVPN